MSPSRSSPSRYPRPLTTAPRRVRAWPLVLLSHALVLSSSAPLAWGQAASALPRETSTVVLPALGDAATQGLSPAQERKLGDRIMRSILSDPDVIDDPLILAYVNDIWQDLLTAARQLGEITPEIDDTHAWEPFLVREHTVNAFALPGGYIGVHLGLLPVTDSPDELASVLAHELSHVTQRHIARMIGQQSAISWVGWASLILGALAASRNPAAGEAMIYGGQAAAIQGQLNFSRDMEREADRVGFGVLSQAGFNPAGMALMFEHLELASRLNDDGSYPYLRTHPLTSERIGDARSRLGLGGWEAARAAIPKQTALAAMHALMSARARVLMDPRHVSLEPLISISAKPGASVLQTVAADYTRAVACMQVGLLDKAQQALQDGQELGRGLPSVQAAVVHRVFTLTQAELALTARQPQQAQAILASLPSANPNLVTLELRPELILGARIALALPQAQGRSGAWAETASRLQTHLSVHDHDATAWSLLSQVWQHLDQPIRAVRAEAEAAAASGDVQGAIDRVQGAQKRFRQPNAADLIELSVLDSRLKTWQRQYREDLREDR